MVDVAVGSVLGAVVWLAYWLLEDAIEAFTLTSGWLGAFLTPPPLLVLLVNSPRFATVTASMIPATLFLVFVHPAPAEDCPCFEDAVAFLSVFAGILIGRNWYPVNFVDATVGTAMDSFLGHSVWGVAVLAKLLLGECFLGVRVGKRGKLIAEICLPGVLSIFTWRLVAKEVCHAVLPPFFRFFSSFLLPRRHYLEATKCMSSLSPTSPLISLANPLLSPADDAYKKTDGLHPIPSILDLPSLHELEGPDQVDELGLSSSSNASTRLLPTALRNRAGGEGGKRPRGAEEKDEVEVAVERCQHQGHRHDGGGGDGVRRDADVLTKVFVVSWAPSRRAFVRTSADPSLCATARVVRWYRLDRYNWHAVGIRQGWSVGIAAGGEGRGGEIIVT